MNDRVDDVDEWNRRIIAEFRADGGTWGGWFEGGPMLILHSTGARSSLERLNPLVYRAVGDHWAIFASKAGAATNPDWYHNVVADPSASIEVGTETVAVTARIAKGEERERAWSTQQADVPRFADYEQSAGDRAIPVVVLERSQRAGLLRLPSR